MYVWEHTTAAYSLRRLSRRKKVRKEKKRKESKGERKTEVLLNRDF